MEIDRLELIVEAEAKKASAELDKLIGKLGQVSTALNGLKTSGLNNLSSGIRQLSSAMSTMSGVKTTDFNRLAKNIEKLGSINKTGLLNAADAIDELVKSVNSMGSISDDAVKIGDLASNISKLGGKSATQAITNLPLLSVALRNFMTTVSSSPLVSQNLINMTNAMANLASQGSKYGSTVKGIASATNTLTKAQKAHTASTFSLTAQVTKLVAAYYTLRRVIGFIGDSIEKSMDYTETINLFQTTYKKIGMETAQDLGMEWGSETADAYAKGFIKAAEGFNDVLTESLGLDPNIMKQYQAIFAQMTNSMGLMAQSSMNIADSFTMLGNDIASLWNIDTADAMKKLQSGLAGQIRPLRSLGIDISQTSLEMTALNYGIEDTIIDMSQAAKVQLRWLSIMDQTEVAFGDMAKTIDSPKNQLRILGQQWSNLSRSIGNVFLPVISKILPYINAVVIALRNMIDTLATAMGYELPDYSDSNIYTDVTGDIEGMEEAADDATAANDKLKQSILGFDELNILSKNRSSGSGKTDTTGSGYGVLDDAINEKTASYMKKFNEEMAKMKNEAKEIAEYIQPKLETIVEWIDNISPAIGGIAIAFTTYKVIEWFSSLASSIGLINPTTGVIALAVGGFAAIYLAVKEYNEKLKTEDLDGRFGDIALSLDEIKTVAEELTTSKYTANIDIYVTEQAKLSELESNIQEEVNTLNKLNWKISVGIALTPDEISQYQETIEQYITDSEAYLVQKQYVVNLAIDAVISDSQSFNNEISALIDEYFNGSRAEMAQLGKDLRAEMDNAIADGVIDATEQATINNLVKEIAEINSQIADAEFKAKLQMITIDGDLTPESFKKLTEKIQETIQERVEKANEASYTVLASVNAAYSVKMENATTPQEKAKIKSDWDAAVKEINQELSKTKGEISFEGTQFSLDSLLTKYGIELNNVRSGVSEKTKATFTTEIVSGITNADPSEGIRALVDGMEWNYLAALDESGMSTATKDGLAEMLKGLEPSQEQYRKIFDDAVKAGLQVPEGIASQLTNIEQLAALTGDRDAILYLIGQQMAESPEYLEMIKSGKLVGSELDSSLIAGMKSKIPDLELQSGKLVTKSGTAVSTKLTEKKDTIKSYGERWVKYFKSAFDNDGTAALSVKGWLSTIDEEIKKHKLPTLSLSTQLSLNITGGNTSDPMGLLGGISQKADGGFVKQYAVGGIPDYGQMFIAREAGPELVGNIGNRTAVVNNDQIVQSVSSGVASAVASVMSQMQSGNGSVIHNILNLDGDVVYEAYNKASRSTNARYNPVTA